MKKEVGSHLEQYDYTYFLNQALEKVPEGIDKREGSIIYDALAPACYQMADFVMQLKGVMLETFTQTATGSYLDLRAEEHGLKRIAATKAVVKGKLVAEENQKLEISEGNKFSTTGESPIYFTVIKHLEGPYYSLMAEVEGAQGNEYIGQLLPIDHFNGLASAELVEVLIPARDAEQDENLRERILKTYQVNNFGGNIADYVQFTSNIDGVGAVQVYPVWNGGGTVRVVILNNAFDLPSQALLDKTQEALSPNETQKGYGIVPIGHQVTVAAPVKKTIDVSLHVDTTGSLLEVVKSKIENKVQEHFLNLRKQWATHDDLYQYSQTIFRSQLIAQLMQVEGVANISDVKLNGLENDLVLQLDNQNQELAFVGSVTYT